MSTVLKSKCLLKIITVYLVFSPRDPRDDLSLELLNLFYSLRHVLKNGNKCSFVVFKRSKCKAANGRQSTHDEQRQTKTDSNRSPEFKNEIH